MKVIIAGSRKINQIHLLKRAIADSGFNDITWVVSGCAKGVDKLGEEWARDNNISIIRFLPSWHKWGKAAGLYRNVDMAEYADAAIILWDGESKGTLHMIDMMKRLKKPYFVRIVNEFAY